MNGLFMQKKQGQLANDATSSVHDYYLRFLSVDGWLIHSQRFLLAGVETRKEMHDFLLFWRKRDRRTDGPTDGPTDQQMDKTLL